MKESEDKGHGLKVMVFYTSYADVSASMSNHPT